MDGGGGLRGCYQCVREARRRSRRRRLIRAALAPRLRRGLGAPGHPAELTGGAIRRLEGCERHASLVKFATKAVQLLLLHDHLVCLPGRRHNLAAVTFEFERHLHLSVIERLLVDVLLVCSVLAAAATAAASTYPDLRVDHTVRRATLPLPLPLPLQVRQTRSPGKRRRNSAIRVALPVAVRLAVSCPRSRSLPNTPPVVLPSDPACPRWHREVATLAARAVAVPWTRTRHHAARVAFEVMFIPRRPSSALSVAERVRVQVRQRAVAVVATAVAATAGPTTVRRAASVLVPSRAVRVALVRSHAPPLSQRCRAVTPRAIAVGVGLMMPVLRVL
mmetsp:Transcript_7012/g.14547  ORF Transcript_7012/g.14547 Transcript_7012/m.14547 type:complete len:333 (+) Transcript_7012:181-1179(+)